MAHTNLPVLLESIGPTARPFRAQAICVSDISLYLPARAGPPSGHGEAVDLDAVIVAVDSVKTALLANDVAHGVRRRIRLRRENI